MFVCVHTHICAHLRIIQSEHGQTEPIQLAAGTYASLLRKFPVYWHHKELGNPGARFNYLSNL